MYYESIKIRIFFEKEFLKIKTARTGTQNFVNGYYFCVGGNVHLCWFELDTSA